MKLHTLTTICLLSATVLSAPACVVTNTNRDVGSVATDGSVYLGWNLIGDGSKSNPNDRDTYDVGGNLGAFSYIRLHAEKPIAIAQVQIVYTDGTVVVAAAPPGLNADEWSAPIPLPGGPRPIASIAVIGRSTTSLLARLEIHGTR